MKSEEKSWIKDALAFVLLLAGDARKALVESDDDPAGLPDYEARQRKKENIEIRRKQFDWLLKFFIASESIFFLSLIISYLYYRAINDVIAQSDFLLNVKSTGQFTVFLVMSSGTLWWGRRELNRGRPNNLILGLVATIVLGGIFLYGQGREYAHLLEKNMSVSTNIFGSAFFTLTGFHGLHVLIGLFVLCIMLILALLGDLRKPHSDAISSTELYWHFVDSVWIVVFFVIYIIPLL